MKSQEAYRYMIVMGLCLTIVFTAKSQNKELTLVKGAKTSSGIAIDDLHRYTLDLDANQFIYANLFQRGIDLKIAVYNPDGKIIGQFDSPNFRNGDEPITLLTEKKGKYILEVSSIDTKDWKGQYDITLITVEPRGTTPEKQIDQIMARFSDPSSPGVSIAVLKDGRIIFRKGYGSAELEYNVPITSSTVFHVASVSKQFTAFAILMLESEGRLSINDDIRKYIPEVPDFGKVITLDHLMHHTSGLRDQWELLAMAGWRLDDNITTKQILRLVSRQKELNFNPGDEMLYCNTGYTLLAEVVARVSGLSFADFTRTRIFEPLKMSHTLFYDDCEKLVKNRAYSFYADSTGYKKSNLNFSTVGATSLFTTSEDLCLWALNFEAPLVGKSFIEKMAQKGVLNNGDTIGYAMGQGMYVYRGLKIFEHGGADAGYRSDLMRIPGEHFSVNVLSNMASFNPGDIAAKVRDIYLADKEVKEPEKSANPEPIADTGKIEPAHDPLLTAPQLPAFDPASVNLAELTGEYYSDELNTGYTFVIESGKLIARHFRTGDVILTPVKENIFGGDQWYFGQIEFVRDENKKITGCKVGGGRVRNLKFIRMESGE